MCEISYEFGREPNSAQNLANVLASPPLAVVPMLGLSREAGQAHPDRNTYDFSLGKRLRPN